MQPSESPQPVTINLEAGVYSWCSCGYSQSMPFCDGKHIGKGFCPVVFKLKKPCEVTLCQCLKSEKRPYCDGSHQKL